MPICTSCGAKVDEGKKFCKHCGQKIDVGVEAGQPDELGDKRAWLLRKLENIQSEVTCAYCASRLPKHICGSAQGPHFRNRIELTETCAFFDENPAEVDYIRAMFLDSYADKAGIDAHEVVRAFKKAIEGGLPADDELDARFFIAKVLTFWINGQDLDIQAQRKLPETAEAVRQYEAALALDREEGFGYFEDERHRFMLSQLDLMYAVEGSFQSIEKGQGDDISDEAAIAYWKQKSPLCDYLSTNPLITTIVQMGNSYARLGNNPAAIECFRRALVAAPVNIADNHQHETDQRNEARVALEHLTGASNRVSAVSTRQNVSQAPLASVGGLRSSKAMITFAVIAILVVAALFSRFWKQSSSSERNRPLDSETLSTPTVVTQADGQHVIRFTDAQQSAISSFLRLHPDMQMASCQSLSYSPSDCISAYADWESNADREKAEIQYPYVAWGDFNRDGYPDFVVPFFGRAAVNNWGWRQWYIVVFQGAAAEKFAPVIVVKDQWGVCFDGMLFHPVRKQIEYWCKSAGGSFKWNGSRFVTKRMIGD